MRPNFSEEELIYLTMNLTYTAMKSYGMFFYPDKTIFENMADSPIKRETVKRIYKVLKEIDIGDYYNILLYKDQLREYSMVVIGEVMRSYHLHNGIYVMMLEDVQKEFKTTLSTYLNEIK